MGAKGLITVNFTIPKSSQRREYWLTHLQAAQITLEERELDVLSDRHANIEVGYLLQKMEEYEGKDNLRGYRLLINELNVLFVGNLTQLNLFRC
jgi:hypothetical protein